jgi:uncharacterized membrane protein YgaE (UPF0421/DUF939 family)
MGISERIQNYLSLLETRRKLIHRNVVLLGGVIFLSILATLADGLVVGLSGRTVYLVTGINIAFGISFLMAWVRLEIVRSSIDLLNNLRT